MAAAFNMTNYTKMAGGLTIRNIITKPCSHSSILHHHYFHVPTKKNYRHQMTHVVSSVLATPSSSPSSFSSSSYSTSMASSSQSMFSSSSSSSSSSSCKLGLALMWREIHGSNNWEGLLNPLHPLLQQEIIRYGNFVSACYDAFDLNPNSTRYLNCKFGKKKLLAEVGLQNSGYEITKYIYATPDLTIPAIGPNGSSCGRWIGFVAISTDEKVANLGRRDVVISFRGTVTNPEWVANLMSSMTTARLDPNNSRPEVKVESGFLSLYTSEESESRFRVSSCREQLLSELSRLMKKCKGERLSITLAGHSMGSSLALLLAYDISEIGLNRVNSDESVPITVFSFGGPRVGNSGFKQRCDELGVKVLRIANVNDPVTKLPGILFNENFRVLGELIPWSYAHVGVELALDFFNVHNPCCVHDLEAYLSLIKCPLHLNDDTAATNWPELLQKAIGFLLSAYTLSNMLPLLHAATEIVYLIPVVFPPQWT